MTRQAGAGDSGAAAQAQGRERERLFTRGVRKIGRYLASRRCVAELRALAGETTGRLLLPAQSSLLRVPFEDAIDDLDHCWRMPDRRFPYSCTDEEGLVLARVILANGLRSGFEIATAFGYSSLYIGLAMQRNGGELTSMDCYVEEWKESFVYEPGEVRAAAQRVRHEVACGRLPQGLLLARTNASLAGLDGSIRFTLGVSPEDVCSVLGHRRLDFAFIDGGHFGYQPTQDFAALSGHLGERCAVLFHDNNGNESVAAAILRAEQFLGTAAVRFPTRFGLTLVHRGLDELSIERIRAAIRYRHRNFA